MTVTFKCGHTLALPRSVGSPPACQTCGERVVARVSDAKPIFKGSCSGPLVVKA